MRAGLTVTTPGTELAVNLLGNTGDGAADNRVDLGSNAVFTIQVTNLNLSTDFADTAKLLGLGGAFDLDNTSGGFDTFATTAVVASNKAVFLVSDNDSGLSGLYLFTSDGAPGTENSIQFNELTLLSVFTATTLTPMTHINIVAVI